MANVVNEQIAEYIEQRCKEITSAARADERDDLRLKLAAIVELGRDQICAALRQDACPGYDPINGG